MHKSLRHFQFLVQPAQVTEDVIKTKIQCLILHLKFNSDLYNMDLYEEFNLFRKKIVL